MEIIEAAKQIEKLHNLSGNDFNSKIELYDKDNDVYFSSDVRLNRVLERDGYIGDRQQIKTKYNDRYFPAEHHYIEVCSPSKNADYIIRE